MNGITKAIARFLYCPSKNYFLSEYLYGVNNVDYTLPNEILYHASLLKVLLQLLCESFTGTTVTLIRTLYL